MYKKLGGLRKALGREKGEKKIRKSALTTGAWVGWGGEGGRIAVPNKGVATIRGPAQEKK